jgi:hypothetical protein
MIGWYEQLMNGYKEMPGGKVPEELKELQKMMKGYQQ